LLLLSQNRIQYRIRQNSIKFQAFLSRRKAECFEHCGRSRIFLFSEKDAFCGMYGVQESPLVETGKRSWYPGRLDDQLALYAKPKLLIVDERGYLSLESSAGQLFFQLVSRRYECGSMLMTSNRAVGEWGMVFGDAVVATAILDRLLHHGTVLTLRESVFDCGKSTGWSRHADMTRRRTIWFGEGCCSHVRFVFVCGRGGAFLHVAWRSISDVA
jgi:hypothetical protein